MKCVWYYAPWTLTNPLWPPVWFGGDEYDRRTLVIQPPLLGALVIALSPEDSA
jgi:hypothetical protein